MSESLTSIGGGLTATKGAAASLDYQIDYSTDLETGEVISGSVWSTATILGGITLSAASFTNSSARVIVSGGTPGQWYVVSNTATGSTGLIHTAAFTLFISDPAFGANTQGLPFPSAQAAIGSMRRDRLLSMIQTYTPGSVLADDYLLEKLLAATSIISHQLRTLLVPTEILPNTAESTELAPLIAAGTPYLLEPAYDYDPQLFIGNTWGRTLTRQRPIIALHSMRFVYATPNPALFDIPPDWFRLDKKYGVINLLPIQSSFSLPLNAFILAALGGGRMVPNFMEIRYSAGLTNVSRDWPEILDIIKKQAVLSVAEDLFLPSSRSESVSADGLSQSASIGFALDDYTNLVQGKIEIIRQALFGIRSFVV